jgi:hypothetical protein
MDRFFLVGFLGFAFLGTPFPGRAATSDETVSTASLLREETDLSRLPLQRNWAAHLDSSCDKTGGNKDCQQFISRDGDTALLADLKGPGAIVRIWSTDVLKVGDHLSSVPTGTLKIYIDDNPVPVINLPFGDLFKGKVPPFMAPLTTINGAAYYTYLPIPYAKHCRITVDKPDQLFYQIDSIHFPDGTKVRPFALPLTPDDNEALQKAQAAWTIPTTTVSALPPTPALASTAGTKLTIAPGATTELPPITGPATIRSLTISAPEVSDTGLRKLVLRIWFDGHKTPDIEAPVADFFGNAFGHKVFETIIFSQNASGDMIFRLPMPCSKSARVSIENGNTESAMVSVALEVQSGPIPAGSLYLRADFNQELTARGKAHIWAQVEGHHGHFVGVVQTMQGGHGLGYCEGDDQVRVDDEKFIPSTQFPTVVAPSNGTGTEDCFNSAWYFGEGMKAQPVSGCLIRQNFGRIDTFRFFLNDAPVFQQTLDAQIEIGGVNDVPNIYYSSVGYWYGDGERTPIMPMPAASTLGFPKVTYETYPIEIEGESLVAKATATGGTVKVKEMTGLQNVWSGDAELFWDGAKKGDTLTIPFDVATAHSYHFFLMLTQSPDNGSYTFAVNGQPLSHDFDGFNRGPETLNVGAVALGDVDLPAGTSQLTITLTNGKSLGLDVIALAPANKPKTP